MAEYRVSASDPVWTFDIDACLQTWANYAKANGITAANWITTVNGSTDAQVAAFVRMLVKSGLKAT